MEVHMCSEVSCSTKSTNVLPSLLEVETEESSVRQESMDSTLLHEETEEKLDEVRLSMLTTIDNPFDPFNDYENWERFDIDHGYNSSSYLARIVTTSDELSDADNLEAVEQAINEIVSLNILGIYKKVSKIV